MRTSSGWVVVGLYRNPWFGEQVTLQPFGPDGWEQRGALWGSKPGREHDKPLATFLMEALDVPHDEAAALAAEISGAWVREWEHHGGGAEARRLVRLTNLMMVAIAVALLLAAIGLVLTIRLLAFAHMPA